MPLPPPVTMNVFPSNLFMAFPRSVRVHACVLAASDLKESLEDLAARVAIWA